MASSSRVAACVPHQVDEHADPAFPVVHRLAALYSSLVSSVLKKLLTDGCPARSTCSSSPSRRTLQRPQIRMSGSAPRQRGRHLEHHRAHVGRRVGIDSGPRRFGAGWVSAVKFRSPEVSNRFLTPSKSKKKASLRAPAKNVKLPDVGRRRRCRTTPRRRRRSCSPTASGSLGLVAGGQVDVDGLAAVLRLGEHEAERDVVAEVAVVVDPDPVDRIGVQEVGLRVGVEDQHRPGRDPSATGTRTDRRGRAADRRAVVRDSSR